MKKISSIIAILAVVLSCISLYQTHSNQLVYVNLNKVIEGYQRTKDAKKVFDDKANIMRAKLDSLESGWQSTIADYEKQRQMLQPAVLKQRQVEMAAKQEEINRYQEAIQKQIQLEDNKMTQTVINDINDYLKDYGKRKGYKILFGASGGGNIMYADESSDVTEDVLSGLNSDYVKK